MNYLYNKPISSILHHMQLLSLAVRGYDKIINRQVRHSKSHKCTLSFSIWWSQDWGDCCSILIIRVYSSVVLTIDYKWCSDYWENFTVLVFISSVPLFTHKCICNCTNILENKVCVRMIMQFSGQTESRQRDWLHRVRIKAYVHTSCW